MKTTVAGAAGTLIRPIAVAANSAGVQGGAAPSNASLSRLTLSEASQLVHARKISPVELTRACLGRIEQLNPKLNAFITVTADSALAEARAAEEEIHRGHWKGPLHGIPLALKDLLDTAAVRTTAASGLFKDRVPLEDAEVVRRLKAAGAVLLGKLNLQEFAYGGSSVVSYFGPVRNPWERDYCAGGSSAGSAAAVAAELCFGALGTDTGGSIRQPAGYCGIVGLKPTYGRVSTRGVIPLAWSLDHVGPMARTVKDVTLMLQVIDRWLRRGRHQQRRSPRSRFRREHRPWDLRLAARYSPRLLLRGTSSRNRGGDGSGSIGVEEPHREPARHRTTGRERPSFRYGCLRDRFYRGGLRLPPGIHFQDARVIPAGNTQSNTGWSGHRNTLVHTKPPPARADPAFRF